MLEYLVAVARVHGRIPKQILLDVRRKPLQMAVAEFYFQALLLVVGLRGLRTAFQEEAKRCR